MDQTYAQFLDYMTAQLPPDPIKQVLMGRAIQAVLDVLRHDLAPYDLSIDLCYAGVSLKFSEFKNQGDSATLFAHTQITVIKAMPEAGLLELGRVTVGKEKSQFNLVAMWDTGTIWIHIFKATPVYHDSPV